MSRPHFLLALNETAARAKGTNLHRIPKQLLAALHLNSQKKEFVRRI
jgi:hypothetical protein